MCIHFYHLVFSFHVTTYDSTESCIAGLVDYMTSWMVFHQSFVTKQPVNGYCLSPCVVEFALNYAVASALAYIIRNAA